MQDVKTRVVEAARRLTETTSIPSVSDVAAARDFVGAYDNFIFDCDGVIWQGGKLLPDSAKALSLLRRLGKNVVFVTNNSSRSREEYRQKFTRLGIDAEVGEICSSSFAVADFLATEHPNVKKAYLVGASGVGDELRQLGIEPIVADNESRYRMPEPEFEKLVVDPGIGAVVCGWDLAFSSYKLCYASLCIQHNPGCLFVCTNQDAFDRLGDRTIPGNGAQVAAIEVATGVEPICTGKPTTWLIQRVLRRYGFDPARTVMIGDRLDTDMLFGANGGIDTALTLTGCTLPAELEELPQDAPERPTQILPCLGMVALAD